MHTNLYNPNRQYYFLLRQTTLFRNRWAIAAVAGFGVMLLISLFTAFVTPAKIPGLVEMYTNVLTLAGLIFTSQIFLELHTPNKAYSFLTLPASTLEKLLGSWLLTSPLYIAFYTLITFVIYLLSCMVGDFSASPLTFFSDSYWNTIGNYMVLQTIFLWGSCYFRKNNFLKTVLVLLVFFTVLGAYAVLIVRLVYGDDLAMEVEATSSNNDLVETLIEPLAHIIFWSVAPYMLVVSYFTLKERQL